MTAEEFRQAIAALDLSQSDAADFLGVAIRTAWSWANGATPVPRAVAMLLRLMVSKGITAAELGTSS